MDLFLQGKVAIVTVGNKGFGAASAHELAKEGAEVLITARNEVGLATTARKIRREYSNNVESISADLTSPGEAERIAKAAHNAHGRIDFLINCARASITADGGWTRALAWGN